MSELPPEPNAESNVSIWNRKLKLDFKGFFTNLSKGVLNLSLTKWDDAAKNAIDMLGDIGLKPTVPQLAGRLIERGMARAVYELLDERLKSHKHKDEIEIKSSDNFDPKLDKAIEQYPVTLTPSFLEQPAQLEIVQFMRERLQVWLSHHGVPEKSATAIAGRLPHYFVWGLHTEVQLSPGTYEPLFTLINTEFSESWRRSKNWLNYQAQFRKKLAEPMFNEPFSLEQLFVWPHAYYLKELEASKEDAEEEQQTRFSRSDRLQQEGKQVYQKHVVELKEVLDHWLEQGEQGDNFRLLSGDPGAGKSSFARMYAEHRMTQGDNVLFVPLHLLNVEGEFGRVLDIYCSEHDYCPQGLLEVKEEPEELLLILDGLDELSKQGKLGAAVATEFVAEVLRKINSLNSSKLRVRVIFCGRPVAVQNVEQSFRAEGQLLFFLPFYLPEEERQNKYDDAHPVYIGQTSLLEKDLRKEWWSKYLRLAEQSYVEVPELLLKEELLDLNSQPLLNYLLAMVYFAEMKEPEKNREIDFSKEINRNQLYAKLLDQVYARDWEPERQHSSLETISDQEFKYLLEEMALCAWHDTERTTTVAELEKACEQANLKSVLEKFEERCSEGVGTLFTSFYFRQAGKNSDLEQTFEFTHKSFGEYLTATRLVGAIEEIVSELEDKVRPRTRRRSYGLPEALFDWLKTFGPTAISFDLLQYLRNEFALRSQHQNNFADWQQKIIQLLELNLQQGMPCEQLPGDKTFQEQTEWARNAEEALMVFHSCCARHTTQVSEVNWPTETSAGDLLARVVRQSKILRERTITDSLDHLRLEGQSLNSLWSVDYNFTNSLMDKASLWEANLSGAELSGANLSGAELWEANLSGAELSGAKLSRANLSEAKLSRAKLWRAELSEAKLWRAELSGANLSGAELSGANLSGAKLSGAKLWRADLSEANLWRANLSEANLSEANLWRAYLSEANLSEANLSGANLSGANLSEADLSNCKLYSWQLQETRGKYIGEPDWLDDKEEDDS